MENKDASICPQCGERIDSANRVFVAPNLLEKIEWECKCGFQKTKVGIMESRTEIDESLKPDKNPT